MQHNDIPATVDHWSQMSEAEQAQWLACQADHDDLMAQAHTRESLYENGLITWDQYCDWEFDYSPLPTLNPPSDQ